MPKVCVVILNYKLKKLTLKCIESVRKSSFKNLQIIVVDNNSGDGLAGEIKKINGVEFIGNNDNLGYTGGNNIGIKAALEKKADYILILNPDTIVDSLAIDEMVQAAIKYSAGIISPKIYFSSTTKLWFAGKIFDKANVLGLHLGVDEEDKGQYDRVKEMEDATGAAMFVTQEVFKRIGFFDEKYFLYYEESDFCFRARQAGIKILYLPQAIVYHENASSTGLGSPLQDYFISRNRLLFAKKFLPFRTQFALLREAFGNLANNNRRLALLDYLSNNFGKGSFIK